MSAEPAPILPAWPAPAAVGAAVTTRDGGVSAGSYASLNLALHVGDDPAAVMENRRRLRAALALPAEPAWLEQVHGTGVARVGEPAAPPGLRSGACAAPAQRGTSPLPAARADAAVAFAPGAVCAVLSADCLPVLLCDRAGTRVGVAHAGWRGLAAGVLEAAIAALRCPPAELMAWLGPAIGPDAFEVGSEVRARFVAQDAGAATAFRANARGRWQADLCALARRRLARAGIAEVFGGGGCTYSQPQRFFSYRRAAPCGRMASLIWLRP